MPQTQHDSTSGSQAHASLHGPSCLLQRVHTQHAETAENQSSSHKTCQLEKKLEREKPTCGKLCRRAAKIRLFSQMCQSDWAKDFSNKSAKQSKIQIRVVVRCGQTTRTHPFHRGRLATSVCLSSNRKTYRQTDGQTDRQTNRQ